MKLRLDTHALLCVVAQALAGNLTIVSADPSFDAYGVPRLW